MQRIISTALMYLASTGLIGKAHAQLDADTYATKFFLDARPTSADLAKVPANAQDVIVAKVRIVSKTYLIGRDQGGRPPPLPRDLFMAEVEVIDVLRGKSRTGERHSVYFGIPGTGRRYKIPHTSRLVGVDYFIVTYIEADQTRRLLGFGVGEDEYAIWQKEVFDHERLRGLPGARP